MAESTLTLKYSTFRSRIAHELGYGAAGSTGASTWDTEQTRQIADCLTSGLHQALYGVGYRWRFLEPTRTFTTTASLTAGTITVVDGVVTGSGTSFPSTAADWDLIVNGVAYGVASYSSATSITLDDLTLDVTAGTTYELARMAYTLDDDFGSMTQLTYVPEEGRRIPVAIVNEALIRQLRASWSLAYTGSPRYGAVRPKSSYTTGQRFELLLWPMANEVFRIDYKCHIIPNAMASDEYPPGGAPYSEMYLASCLAVAEQRYKGGPGKHAADFQRLAKAAAEFDRRQVTAETLGPMEDRSDDTQAYGIDGYRVVFTP